MAYLGALLARTADGWQGSEIDLDTVDDLAGMTERMRDAAVDDDTVLLLVEQEDNWFGVVRLDGEEDARIFVSDGAAVLRGAYSELVSTLLVTAPVDGNEEAEGGDRISDGGIGDGVIEDRDVAAAVIDDDDESVDDVTDVLPDTDAELEAREHAIGPGPFGDVNLLTDLGVSARELTSLCADKIAPADALDELADALGAADELDAVR